VKLLPKDHRPKLLGSRAMERTDPPPREPEKTTPDPRPPNGDPSAPIRHLTPFRLILILSVGFLSLFLFIRGFAIEPFGVPTGSMAPALIGNHREGACPRCGYNVRVGFPASGGNSARHFKRVCCPNCGYGLHHDHDFSIAEQPDLAGDRVLVDKNVFNLRRPRRWEMAVFRCPDTDPKERGKPYVKRVVGLPGELITIIGGDAFANHELLRKSLEELRETRVIVLDMSFVPNPGGWNKHWDADETVLKGSVLTLDAVNDNVALTYRHWNIDAAAEEPIKSWNSYDGMPQSPAFLPAAHDFSIECDVEVVSAHPDAHFACRLFDGADAIVGEVAVARAGGRALLNHEDHGQLALVHDVALRPGRRHRFEFAFVDRRATLAIDGRSVLVHNLPPVAQRDEVSRPLRIAAHGCKLVVRNLRLYRDTYYTRYGENGTRKAVALGPGEYFMLGDNSANSQDSRKWSQPAVPEADFVGKPFLIHQPLRTARVTVGGRERVFQTVDWSRLRWLH
jgi:signal peptidase I